MKGTQGYGIRGGNWVSKGRRFRMLAEMRMLPMVAIVALGQAASPRMEREEDVVYLIRAEEKKAHLRLKTGEGRGRNVIFTFGK